MLPQTLYHLPKLYKNQYSHPDTLKKLQEKKLRHIITFAYKNSKLYKEKFKKAQITPLDITTLNDITKIPLTTKNDIKSVFPDGVVPPGFSEKNCIAMTTSGTSGNVFTVLIDSEGRNYSAAVTVRDHLAHGLRPWHKFLTLQHDPAQLKKQSKNLFYQKKDISGILPQETLVEKAVAYNPDFMGGHPSAYVAMAKVVEEKGIKGITPIKIFIGGEIALPSFRAYIEKVFNCKTLNKYGAYETHSIAWECNHYNMHMNADSILVEFVKDGEPVSAGERGEIVITNFWNKALPFIRYRIGDVGIPSDETCSCGRTFPLIKDLEGRTDDLIVLPSGNVVPPTRLIPSFFMTPYIEAFKVIQDKRTHIHIQIVPRREISEPEEKEFLEEIQTILGEPVDIDIEKVDHIKKVGRGKFKAVTSKIPLDLASSKG
ncbi:MAG: hypothetical protein PVF58_20845 [Candidatus Methanofastidiosia archaeon]|jgi:phenylacetate-CoA ligase